MKDEVHALREDVIRSKSAQSGDVIPADKVPVAGNVHCSVLCLSLLSARVRVQYREAMREAYKIRSAELRAAEETSDLLRGQIRE